MNRIEFCTRPHKATPWSERKAPPRPPNRAVPPITAQAIDCNSKFCARLNEASLIWPARTMPVMPTRAPIRV